MKLTLDQDSVARILLAHLTFRQKRVAPGVDCMVIFRHRDGDGEFEVEVRTEADVPPERVPGVVYLADIRRSRP